MNFTPIFIIEHLSKLIPLLSSTNQTETNVMNSGIL